MVGSLDPLRLSRVCQAWVRVSPVCRGSAARIPSESMMCLLGSFLIAAIKDLTNKFKGGGVGLGSQWGQAIMVEKTLHLEGKTW